MSASIHMPWLEPLVWTTGAEKVKIAPTVESAGHRHTHTHAQKHTHIIIKSATLIQDRGGLDVCARTCTDMAFCAHAAYNIIMPYRAFC